MNYTQFCLETGAIFDPTGAYRYRLWRIWDSNAPRAAFVLLNPSTADVSNDDPTIRRCLGFARSWGFGGLEVINLFAYRATDPAALCHVADPVGPENAQHIRGACACAEKIVLAWGNHGALNGQGRIVLDLLQELGTLYSLGQTKSGHPRHPLYVRENALPVPYALRLSAP